MTGNALSGIALSMAEEIALALTTFTQDDIFSFLSIVQLGPDPENLIGEAVFSASNGDKKIKALCFRPGTDVGNHFHTNKSSRFKFSRGAGELKFVVSGTTTRLSAAKAQFVDTKPNEHYSMKNESAASVVVVEIYSAEPGDIEEFVPDVERKAVWENGRPA